MTFLTILRVTEISCSFRLVLEEKTGKEIPESSKLEFLEKFLTNNLDLSDTENNTSGPLHRGGISNLPLLRTLLAIHQKSRKPSFSKVMNSFVLVAYTSLAVSIAEITSLSELYFRLRIFILLVQAKEIISMNYSRAAQAAENHGDE